MRVKHFFIVGAAVLLLFVFSTFWITAYTQRIFGPASASLGFFHRLEYSARLIWHDGMLTTPRDRNAGDTTFLIDAGDSVFEIADKLEEAGLISSSQAFYDYTVYTGMDMTIQAGVYKLSPALSIVEISRELQDATPEEIIFIILPGWRLEEIAESLPTSGLDIPPEEFLAVTRMKPGLLDFLPQGATAEGFLFPDEYTLHRTTSVEALIETFTRNLILHITPELRAGFDSQGLNVYQAVTLASLVEREAVRTEEQAMIASVFINRLNSGIKLDSDPTVQYALGFNTSQKTWWTNPLSAAHLQIDSPFNTYLYAGLPPGPIANPGESALRAVAFPDQSPYYYFRARCDSSGYHEFAVTFEEHLQNSCP